MGISTIPVYPEATKDLRLLCKGLSLILSKSRYQSSKANTPHIHIPLTFTNESQETINGGHRKLEGTLQNKCKTTAQYWKNQRDLVLNRIPCRNLTLIPNMAIFKTEPPFLDIHISFRVGFYILPGKMGDKEFPHLCLQTVFAATQMAFHTSAEARTSFKSSWFTNLKIHQPSPTYF